MAGMAPESVQEDEMSLVLSRDAKPRLKWTAELHQIFVDAVVQLGGADKATPKSLMRVMNIHGLSLYHLKSHLQKYRHGKSHQSRQSCNKKQQQDNRSHHIGAERCDAMQEQKNEKVQIAQALQVQMEVQRKIHEQIEVQRHLQLRIEAQGKYLQSALKKAQEILSKAELSLLMVDMGCQSSSESALTSETGQPLSKDKGNIEQQLTSLESCGRKEETELILMSGHEPKRRLMSSSCDDDICVEKPSDNKRFKTSRYDDETLKSSGFLENLDLNGKNLQNHFDHHTGCKAIDLNREWQLETV